MYKFPIGVMMESFRLPTLQAIEKAAAIGAQGIQMYATKGEHAPENMTAADRKELLNQLKDHGLVFSALCGDLGKGFGNPELNPALIEKSKRILDLAKDLECDIVTTHIGVVPTDPNHPRYAIMQDACGELARYADSVEAHFAIETGPETSAVLKNFLDGLGSRGVSVNLDPANLVMVTGDDPVQAVYNLKDYIVHTHAKDGIQIANVGADVVYDFFAEGGIGDLRLDECFKELPLGQGHVDFNLWLKALEDIGYNGFVTIEREAGPTPEDDIRLAMNFLKEVMAKN